MEILELDDYPICLGDVGQSLPALLERHPFSALFILTDDNRRRYCLPRILPQLPAEKTEKILEIPSGEIHKNIETCQ